MKKKLPALMTILIAAGLVVLYLATRECKHEWLAATCTQPETCAICEATQGKPAPHVWQEANCLTPKTCAICGQTEGEPLAHEWQPATCLAAETCKLCGDTQGELADHVWMAATCSEPQTCKVCQLTQGEKLMHIWADATCHVPQICTLCNAQQGSPLPHQWLSATCHAPETCKLCGDTQGKKLSHEWADATCHTAKTCTLCGETKGKTLSHKWQDADCHTPETCSLCGDQQGSPRPHKWKAADCHTPETCSLCGDQQGDPLPHSWLAADCHTPETCALCGDTQGEPLAHVWQPADCHTPETCALCGDTQGEPLDHVWQSATCLVPETCELCGTSQGPVADHIWTDTNCLSPAPCTVCGTLEGISLTHQWMADKKICELCGADERSTDERFMENLILGLEKRWALTTADLAEAQAIADAEAELTGKPAKRVQKVFTREKMEKYIQAEYDAILPFANQVFENEEIGEWAFMYIDGVIVSKQEIEAITDTTHLVDQYTRDGFHMQCAALYHLNQMMPITVAEENLAELQAMLSNGETIAKVSDLMEQVAFQNVETIYDGRDRFEAFVTNDTGLHFATFSFDVNQLDSSNNLIASETLSLNDWEPGEQHKFSFLAEPGAHKIQLTFANWMFPDGQTADAQTTADEIEEAVIEIDSADITPIDEAIEPSFEEELSASDENAA